MCIGGQKRDGGEEEAEAQVIKIMKASYFSLHAISPFHFGDELSYYLIFTAAISICIL